MRWQSGARPSREATSESRSRRSRTRGRARASSARSLPTPSRYRRSRPKPSAPSRSTWPCSSAPLTRRRRSCVRRGLASREKRWTASKTWGPMAPRLRPTAARRPPQRTSCPRAWTSRSWAHSCSSSGGGGRRSRRSSHSLSQSRAGRLSSRKVRWNARYWAWRRRWRTRRATWRALWPRRRRRRASATRRQHARRRRFSSDHALRQAGSGRLSV
mmetsp:Transcript_825/g.2500  ORF Transcript_825/g.2500 Transcript_825/m.2500 type:complete len:215 (-) Transcript_825:1250-1894(-)